MLDVMDNILLQEVFDDLIALEDINTNFELNSSYDFNWNDAIHYLNISGLDKAKEYIEDAIGYPQQNIPNNNSLYLRNFPFFRKNYNWYCKFF